MILPITYVEAYKVEFDDYVEKTIHCMKATTLR